MLPYFSFLFLFLVMFCIGCFRQAVFSFGCQKKVAAGHVRQMVVLYSDNYMGICLGGLNIGCLQQVVVL